MTKLTYSVRRVVHVSLHNAVEIHKAIDEQPAVYRIADASANSIVLSDTYVVVRSDNLKHVFSSFPTVESANEHAKECQTYFDQVTERALISKKINQK